MSEINPAGINPAGDEVQEVNARVFKTRAFASFARRARLDDAALCAAVARMRRGLVDADLGGGVVKQRIARPGAGRSGGFRTIVVFRVGRHTFFVYGFAKNQRDNISAAELTDFRDLATLLNGFDQERLQAALEAAELTEVICNENEAEAIQE